MIPRWCSAPVAPYRRIPSTAQHKRNDAGIHPPTQFLLSKRLSSAARSSPSVPVPSRAKWGAVILALSTRREPRVGRRAGTRCREESDNGERSDRWLGEKWTSMRRAGERFALVNGAAPEELPLRIRTPAEWAALSMGDCLALLNDHAYLEKKAASNALELLNRWAEPACPAEWTQTLAAIASDEASHLTGVIRLLLARGGRLERTHRNDYAHRLRLNVRKGAGNQELLDRLLIAALIELRSCERFDLLALLPWTGCRAVAVLRPLMVIGTRALPGVPAPRGLDHAGADSGRALARAPGDRGSGDSRAAAGLSNSQRLARSAAE